MFISPAIVQLNEHNMELVQISHAAALFLLTTLYIAIQLPANMSLFNEFMCGPMDMQDIKGETDAEAEHDTGSLPDRLINPDVYEPVILTTEEYTAAETKDSINDPRKLTPVYTYGSVN